MTGIKAVCWPDRKETEGTKKTESQGACTGSPLPGPCRSPTAKAGVVARPTEAFPALAE